MSEDGKTYEMMWDCKYCGPTKLLGKTHRFCPECGAEQDPEKRYFPPDNEKVAVEDHQYVGADVMCTACNTAMSAAVKNCTNCGGAMSQGSAVTAQADQIVGADGRVVAPPPQPVPGQPAPQETKKSKGLLIGIVVLVLVVACIVAFFTLPKQAALEVSSHSWERTIALERFGKVKEKGPCKSMPSDAKELSRNKGKKKCKTRKIDQGDGTFKEKKECTEPVEQCTYEVEKWSVSRTLKETGRGLDSKIKWPEVDLGKKGKKRKKSKKSKKGKKGDEREGKRTETYTVHFKDKEGGDEKTCSFTKKSDWEGYKKGSSWTAEARLVGGGLNCGTLKPAK